MKTLFDLNIKHTTYDRFFQITFHDSGFMSIKTLKDKPKKITNITYLFDKLNQLTLIDTSVLRNILDNSLSANRQTGVYLYFTKDQSGRYTLNPSDDDAGYTLVYEMYSQNEFSWKNDLGQLTRTPASGPAYITLDHSTGAVEGFTFVRSDHRRIGSGSFMNHALELLTQDLDSGSDQYIATLITVNRWYSLMS